MMLTRIGAALATLEHWISERVLQLTCTAEDMIPLAKACEFAGSRGDGVHLWKEAERAQLRAELDAAYFHLYGMERDDVEYILSTFTNTGLVPPEERGAQQLMWERDSAGELILQAYDRLAGTAPGIPPGYPEPEKLVTENCVRPATETLEAEPIQRKAKERKPKDSDPGVSPTKRDRKRGKREGFWEG